MQNNFGAAKISAPACSASIKAFVPDLAIVPKLLIKSAFVIPIPVSVRVNVRSFLLGTILMNNSLPDSNLDGSRTYIAAVRNQFTQKNFFVRIKCVDNQRHQLSDFSLEGESFAGLLLGFRVFWHPRDISAIEMQENLLEKHHKCFFFTQWTLSTVLGPLPTCSGTR
uniref:Uncharacterized protein n=1 Tax=Romanomermis culicivorax TaxID=13658 RepID=A0A915HGH8_ROMCU